MTEKRFNYHHDGFGAYYLCDKKEGNYEDGIIGEIWADKSDMKELVDLLNNLHEENQALKSDRARYEEECRLDVFKKLSEENEELKKEIEIINKDHQNLHEKHIELQEDYKKCCRKNTMIMGNEGTAKRVYLNLKECFEE